MSNIPKVLLFSAACLHFAACFYVEKVPAKEVTPSTNQSNWQTKVVTPMQTAQTLLQQPTKASTASAAQTEALAGLDAIIADLTKRQSQCKGGLCKASQCKKPGSPRPGSPKAGSKPGASSNAGEIEVKTQALAAGELVKDLWGKLPERQRQQILQPLNEKFLPKYASEIEAYFRILADPNRSLRKLQ
jgi:hypothetical protein